ncbi:MAG: hypothetical protein A2020_08425 [Lentisphaerae bacterium GWF2_45_14]|nr:MAG: hypothetical protein A2020_08425 [Lentisphaerae bacterium GWF2_45_14]
MRRYSKLIALLGAMALLSDSAMGGNLLPGDTSFETETSSLATRCWDGLKTEQNKEDSFDGAASLKCSRKGSIGSRAVDLIPGKSYTFSIYAKVLERPVKARILVANPAWKHTVTSDTFTLKSDKWSRHSVTFKAKEKLYFVGLSLFEPGAILTDAWQLEEEALSQEYASPTPVFLGIDFDSRFQNTFFPDEPATINIYAYKAWAGIKAEDIKLELKVKDYLGRNILNETRKLSFGKSTHVLETWTFRPGKLGWFEVKADVLINGKKVASAPTASLVFVSRPMKIAAGLKPFCGLAGTSETFPALKRIGVKWVETLVHWSEVEKKRGVYDWSSLDSLAERKEEGYWNIVTLAHLPAAPEWAWAENDAKSELVKKLKEDKKLRWGIFPDKDKIVDWEKMLADMVRKFGSDIDIYEIGGEDDLTAGKNEYYLKKYPSSRARDYFVIEPFLDIYAKMISSAAEEIKKQKPNALIGGIRPSGVDSTGFNYEFPFSTPVFKKCGKSFNLFPMDPYCCPRYISSRLPKASIPEYILDNTFKKALELGEKYGCNQKIYISEKGYGIDYRDVECIDVLNEQLNRMARIYLLSRSTPNVLLCNWFCPVSKEVAHGENEFYLYGLWMGDNNPRPMPAVAAYSAVAGVIENVTKTSLVDLHSQVRIAVFAKADGAASAAVWMPEGKGEMELPRKLSNLQILDVMGNPIPLKITDGKLDIPIGEAPLYFKLPSPSFWNDLGNWLTLGSSEDSFKNLEQLLSQSKVSLSLIDMEIQEINSETANLFLKNKTNTALSVTLDLLPGQKIELLPLKTKCLSIKTPKKEKWQCVAEIADGKKTEKYFKRKGVSSIYQNSAKIDIDGNLSDWKMPPLVSMMDRAHLEPPDPHIPWENTEDLGVKVFMSWDKYYLYLAAEVNDDSHFNNSEVSQLYNGDSWQFAFDPQNNASVNSALNNQKGYSDDDFEYGVALLKTVPAIYKWQGRGRLPDSKNLAITRDEQNGKTIYEMRIPLKDLKIAPDKAFGFNTVFFDDDNGGGQEYCFAFAPGITGGKKPEVFPKFILSTGVGTQDIEHR